MIMQRQADGSYAHIGFIKTPTEAIDKVVDKNGDLYFEQGYSHNTSGYPLTLTDGIGKPLSDYKIYGNIMQNGTPTPEAPVEVLGVGNKTDNGYEIPVVCRGKNLAVTENKEVTLNGVTLSVNNGECSFKGTATGSGGRNTLTISSKFLLKSGTYYFSVYGYDKIYVSDKTTNGIVGYPNSYFTIADDILVIIGFNIEEGQTYDISGIHIQLETGDAVTEYEPYHEPITNTITLPQPLFKGDYLTKDKSGGKVHRAWGVKVFDGTEEWEKNVTDPSDYLYYIYRDNINANVGRGDVRCDHIPTVSSPPHSNIGIYNKHPGGAMYFCFGTDIMNTQPSGNTVKGFKEYLTSEYAKGTPVTVYYPLAEPIEESIKLPDIPTFDGTTIIETNTELSPLSIEATYKAKKPVVYGCHINPNEPDSFNAVTYLEDAVGMTPAKMGADSFDYGSWQNAFFMPKPCMLKYDGTVAYYLDPNDYSRKLDGTPSDIANPDFEGNAMMEWGLIWYKFAGGAEDGEGYFYMSDHRVDDSYHCWCNYDCDNNVIPHFYTAIYNSTGTEKLRSISGVTLTSANGNGDTTGKQEITRALANNTTEKVEWYTDVYADRILINALLVLISKSLNTQASFGRGLDSGGEGAKNAYTTGSLNNKGLFYGVTGKGDSAVKTFGMENWWGCVWRRTAGCIVSEHDYKVKLTYGTADGTTVNGYNSTGEGYVSTGTMLPTNGYIKKCKYSEKGYAPFNINGSASTYYADYYYPLTSTGTRYLIVGGDTDSGALAGAFSIRLNVYFSASDWRVSAALSCKPLA